MMYDSIRLESGKEYTLRGIFNGNNKVVIPDLQRDYCWGDVAWNKESNSYSEIVTPFLENLWSLFLEHKERPYSKTTLGMVYGYEHPSHQINLCDGQQRITTLYLLLGMLNRLTIEPGAFPMGSIKSILISDDELNADDKEPYLLYSIRESSLYFLSDLVYHFFLSDEVDNVKAIRNQDGWFFEEYDNDPTIRSIVSALGLIETFLKDNLTTAREANDFAAFLSNDLFFLYYDMGDRLKGEETFVVINTTGEPLSPSENIKPILLGNINEYELMKKFSDEWEERENWFWHRRRKSENTADDAHFEFLKWVAQINLRQEKQNEKDIDVRKFFLQKAEKDKVGTLQEIQEYYNALKRIVDSQREIADVWKITLPAESRRKNNLSALRDSDINVVLPLLHYMKVFPNAALYSQFVRRIRKNYFDYLRRREGFVQWRYILRIIDLCEKGESTVLTFDTEQAGLFPGLPELHTTWFGENERFVRNLEPLFVLSDIQAMENHPDLMGDLSIIRLSLGDNSLTKENVSKIWESFKLTYEAMFEDGLEDKCLSNLIRLYKVLIGCPQVERPYRTSGMTGACFSWTGSGDPSYYAYLHKEQFHDLIKSDNMKSFIKTYLRNNYSYKNLFLEETEESLFNPKEFFKAWLILKVTHAGNVAVPYVDGNAGLAVYDECAWNKIDKTLAFSSANAIGGYAIKAPGNYIAYANDYWWGYSFCFDRPLIDDLPRELFIKIQNGEASLDKELSRSTIESLKKEWDEFVRES